jgi:pyruvate formate lyase activating enzyme
MKAEVAYYQKLEDASVRCEVCPQYCRIKPEKRGICRVRVNLGGSLYATNYGEHSSIALDPIEKKPLYHFCPGQNILSVGTVGCNFSCGFCQNYQIAHEDPPTRFFSPLDLLSLAEESRSRGSIGVAYTYSEPLMWYEYLLDTLPVIRDGGFRNVLVTNGYINPRPLETILPYIDAMNIDLKSFSEKYYRTNCHGRLEPVKEAIKLCVGRTHVEVTTLLVTGLNDTPEEIEELSRWIAALDSSIPLHLSAYYPAYKVNLPPTPQATMKIAREIAKQHLQYVYVGNMAGFDNNTLCPHCQATLVTRQGYRVKLEGLEGDHCVECGRIVSFLAHKKEGFDHYS